MGLKCSVLGHAYGETTVERDREERGSEVVITIRELETCDRCGDTRVVTENKEVTTIETQDDRPDVTAEDAMAAMDASDRPDDAGADADAADESGPDDAGTAPDDSVVDDAEGGAAVADESTSAPSPGTVEDQGAEILDADEAAADDEPVDDELADPTIENDTDVPGDSVDEEDAVILDDEPATETASAPTGAADEPTADEAAANAAAGTSSDEEGSDGADEPAPFDPPAEDDDDEDPLGEWPEETLRDDEGWTPSEDLTGTVDDVDPDETVDREFSTSSAVTVPEGEFYCEECGYTTDVEATSLRAGDFCPECRTGTLVHRHEE